MDHVIPYRLCSVYYKSHDIITLSSELVVLIDVELPGMITEFHDTGGNG